MIQSLVFLISLAYANQNVPEPVLKIIETKEKGIFLSVTPPAQHHLNLKTPTKASLGEKTSPLVKKTPLEVIFQNKSKNPTAFSTTVYLCDNENTYCVKKKVTGAISDLTKEQKEISITTPNIKSHSQENNHGARMAKKQGFIYNDWEKALEKAKKENKPLFIDFFAIWCPPCNMLDASVFPTSQFQKAAKGFVLLKLDADSEASWKLKEKFKITGYPTIVKTSSDGTETDRLVGYYPRNAVVTFLKGSLLKNPEEMELEKIAEDLNAAEPNSDTRKELSLKYLSTIDKFLQVKESERNLLTADLLSMKAGEIKTTGSPDAARKAYNEAAKAFRDQGALAKKAGFTDRGSLLEEAYCHNESGNTPEALRIYKSMEKKYPEEFTFYYAHSKLFFNKKKYKESLPLAQKAFEYSYGDNRLRAAILLATNLSELKQNAEAKNIITATLQESPAPSDPQNRTHRYLKQLRELGEKI